MRGTNFLHTNHCQGIVRHCSPLHVVTDYKGVRSTTELRVPAPQQSCLSVGLNAGAKDMLLVVCYLLVSQAGGQFVGLDAGAQVRGEETKRRRERRRGKRPWGGQVWM